MTDITNTTPPVHIKVQEQTRAKIGKIFVRGFFIGIFGSILLVVLYNITMFLLTQSSALFIDLTTVIPLLGSVVGTPLGFVMGYYFKEDGSDNNI